jgi:hypothetical protein
VFSHPDSQSGVIGIPVASLKKIIDEDDDKLIKLYQNLAYRLIKMWPDHFNWLTHFSVEELRLLT